MRTSSGEASSIPRQSRGHGLLPPSVTTTELSVVVCTYSDGRWGDLVDAVASLQEQRRPPGEIVVVVDHNPPLAARARQHLPGVVVVENKQAPGLSGARNSGTAAARGSLVAFLDDDAVTDPNWTEGLVDAFADPCVVAVGGRIEPLWADRQPSWFPDEFRWVVGCTYRGMPITTARVRNVLGCNMAFRRAVLEEVGGFTTGIGRVGAHPVGCEETELCIRIAQRWRDSVVLFEPAASVRHRVPEPRCRWSYFRRRCFWEGISKARVTTSVGRADGLASERRYVATTLVRGVAGTLVGPDRLWTNLTRAGAIIGGLVWTTVGYGVGVASTWRVWSKSRRWDARLSPSA